MGNPHLVIFIDDIKNCKFAGNRSETGESSAFFPERTNIEFVEVLSHNKHKPLQEKSNTYEI